MTQEQIRSKLALYAYAYELESDYLVSDHEYDELSKKVDLSVDTGDQILDKFFNREFSPYTGMWVHSHPYKHLLKQEYESLNR